MKRWFVMTSAIGALAILPLGAAHAANACVQEIAQTRADWDALHLTPSPKPTGMAHGIHGHAHITAQLATMQFHLGAAQELCDAGKDHEALLHLDVVRAFLNLPEMQHPAEHHYEHHQQR